MWVERKARADHLGLCELGKKLVFILILIRKSLEVLNKRKGLCYVNENQHSGCWVENRWKKARMEAVSQLRLSLRCKMMMTQSKVVDMVGFWLNSEG